MVNGFHKIQTWLENAFVDIWKLFWCYLLDGAVCWLVKEAILEVMDTRSSQCLSSWKFGEIICDPHAYITCVKEYQYGSSRRLLVGVCYSSSSGLLCILDLHLSKITRTIEIPQKVCECLTLRQAINQLLKSNCPEFFRLVKQSFFEILVID